MLRKVTDVVLLKVVSKCIIFISTVLIIRHTSIETFGEYSYAMSLAILLSAASTSGFGQLYSKELNANLTKEQQCNLLHRGTTFSFLVSCCMILVSVVLVESVFLTIFILLLVFRVTTYNITYFFIGLKQAQLGTFLQFVFAPLLLCVGVFLAPMAWNKLQVYDILQISMISFAIVSVVSVYVVYNRGYDISFRLPDTSFLKALFPFACLAVLNTISVEIPTVILGNLSAAEEVALYKVSLQLALLVSIVLQSLNTVIAPEISRCFHAGDSDLLQFLLRRSVRIAFFGSALVCAFYFFFGEFIMVTFFGEEYRSAYDICLLLMLGQLINVYFGSVGVLLNMSGNGRLSLIAQVLSTFACVVCLIVLVPAFGAFGAAISFIIAVIVLNIVSTMYCYNVLRITTWLH